MENNILKVCVTGAAGSIAYSLIPLLASGLVFGPNNSIHLSLLDLKSQEQNLKGILLELEDGAYHTLTKAEYGFDPKVMFRDCDVIIFLGGASRQPGQDKRDWLNVNGTIFKEQGEALNEVGKPTCKCVVVANPCNTNCMVLQKYCPKIPKKNFSALSRLDHNRAIGQLARKLDTDISKIQKVTIWGNHSWLQFPDLSQTEVEGKRINHLVTEDYIKNEFIDLIQKRAMEVVQQRKKPTIMSAAQAISDHLRDWYFGTAEGDWVSMSVISDGSYGIPEGLVFSMPVKCKNFEYEIVQDLRLGDFAKEKIRVAVDELDGEKEDVFSEIEAEVITA